MRHGKRDEADEDATFGELLGELSRQRQARRAETGAYAGKPLLGYVRTAGSDVHVVDEAKREKVRDVWRLAAEGMPLRRLLAECHALGLTSAAGKKLSLNSLHLMLTNPFYAGMVRTPKGPVPGKHEALVSRTTFETVRQKLAERRKRGQENGTFASGVQR